VSENDLSAGPNVFRALFSYRPRETTTAEENFLTEALVYTLRKSPSATRAWVRLITRNQLEPQSIRWDTQSLLESSEDDPLSIPDLQAYGTTTEGKVFKFICEHKWKAQVSLPQLEKYSKSFGKGEVRHLALLYANDRDRALASQFNPPPGISYGCWKWDEVFSVLSAIAEPEPMLQEFLAFLREVGLSPGQPIAKKESVECAQGMAEFENRKAFRKKLLRYCKKLAHEFDWNCVPSFFENQFDGRDSYGRCAIVRYRDGIGPHLALGFYYDVSDHKLALLNPREGIDLKIRLIARPNRNRFVEPVLACLRSRIPELNRRHATVHLRSDPGNGNDHTLFIARRILSEVINDGQTEIQQIENIYGQLRDWCSALFADDSVIENLKTIKGHSGGKKR